MKKQRLRQSSSQWDDVIDATVTLFVHGTTSTNASPIIHFKRYKQFYRGQIEDMIGVILEQCGIWGNDMTIPYIFAEMKKLNGGKVSVPITNFGKVVVNACRKTWGVQEVYQILQQLEQQYLDHVSKRKKIK